MLRVSIDKRIFSFARNKREKLTLKFILQNKLLVILQCTGSFEKPHMLVHYNAAPTLAGITPIAAAPSKNDGNTIASSA